MKGLLTGYGRGLASFFFLAVFLWCTALILFPQFTMVERALIAPKRQLDSSIAALLEQDSRTCISVLNGYLKDRQKPAAKEKPSGLAVPSARTMATPSPGTMAIPSMSGPAKGKPRPYILQCERSNTHQKMVRGEGEAVYLDELYDLPALKVVDADTLEKQIETADKIAVLAADLTKKLLDIEANASPFTTSNFEALIQPRLIPLSDEAKEAEARDPVKLLYTAMGLRFTKDGEVYERLGAVILVRTLSFAVMATLLALVICYPIAYKLALASTPERAVWLFLGLVIPYAIVELMRIYAWTSIIDNRGLINTALDALGFINLAAGEWIQFKRSALMVFIVIVYTYVLFMVFPMVNVMATLDRNQIEAARDLGSSTWRIHWRIIIPHAKPGIAVGAIATFMLAAGAFSVPRIISRGLQSEWFAQTIYNKFFESNNSNVGAAYSLTYTIVCFIMVAVFMYLMRTRLKDFAQAR